jgi:hypothetical protein
MIVSQIPEATRCARHPGVETYLRCSRCDTPICPSCLVQTPVGARCRSCAGLRRLPTFRADKRLLARGFLAGLAAAALGAVLIEMVRGFGFILTIVLGFLVAEAVSWAANRRRGPYFAWTAAVSAVVGMVLGRGVLVFIALGTLAPELRLRGALMAMAAINIIGWVMIVVVAGIAFYRLRQ